MSNCCESSQNTEQTQLIKDQRWLKIAFWLLISTLLFTTLEAVVSIMSGYKANSVVLMGFGLDSIIEMSVSGLMVWRLAKELNGLDSETIAGRGKQFIKMLMRARENTGHYGENIIHMAKKNTSFEARAIR